MNITAITHNFPPETGAPAARMYEMSKEWVALGHHVDLITAFPNHPNGIIPKDYQGYRYMLEEMDGIKVHRNFIYATANKDVFKRIIGFLSFMISSALLSFHKIKKPDVVIATSPQFFTLFTGFFYSRMKKAPFILDIRDLWPEAIVELGVIQNKWIIRILEKIELFFYRHSTHIVVVTEAYKKNMIARGIDGNKIDIVTNGCNLSLFYRAPKNQQLLEMYNLSNKFVVQYMGTLGLAHGLEIILNVAESLATHPDIHFIIIGEGARKEQLMQLASEKKLQNVTFIPSQTKQQVPDYYRLADVALVTLKKIPLFQTVIPSKIFEILGCGIPIIGAVEGEAAALLERSQAAVVVPPEDEAALAKAILQLKDNQALRTEMGILGEKFIKDNYSRTFLSQKYIQIIKKVVK
ncbi:MAG: glycosyltransferase family 4 protein [Hyphomonadaceae bacterium]|nr:glycosyltransferase family 4 protein [Clostridia bacterium]